MKHKPIDFPGIEMVKASCKGKGITRQNAPEETLFYTLTAQKGRSYGLNSGLEFAETTEGYKLMIN